MERIFKLGIGLDRPGEIVYESKLEAADAEGFAKLLGDVWLKFTKQAQAHEGPDVMLHLVVEVDDAGWGDFELEDEIMDYLD